MKITRLTLNENYTIMDKLAIGDMFIRNSNNGDERYYVIIEYNQEDSSFFCIDLLSRTTEIFYNYEIVKKVAEIKI